MTMPDAHSKKQAKAIAAPSLELPDHSLGPDPVAGVDPVCEDAPYPRLEPGKYDAECIEVRIYRDPQFRSWKCRLKYMVLPDGLVVYGFLHLGKGAGRMSEPGQSTGERGSSRTANSHENAKLSAAGYSRKRYS
jgi:hypothetical protein